MRPHTVRKLQAAFFSLVVCLIFSAASAVQVQAQTGPCVASGSGAMAAVAASMNQSIADLQAQGASVTCDSGSMYINFPSGLVFIISAPDGGAVQMWSFDPLTGRTTNWYIVGDAEPTVIIQDDTYGLINAGSGWFSVFYPVGNPFSAAIQNPMTALFMGYGFPPPGYGPPVRPQPLQGGGGPPQ